jgi:predicted nuclease of predicted toxin-antitoxin system
VKFLVDAQRPARLAELLKRAGHDAMHTRELPKGNRSTDREIAQVADREGRVVVTKDRDFRDGHLLHRSPQSLLVVAIGNITNDALLSLLEVHLDEIVSAFEETGFVELSQDALSLGRPTHRTDS